MKPNGKFAFRIAVLAFSALSLLRAPASAESARGNFTVTAETHWARLLLSPGEYEFSMSRDRSGYMVMLRSRDTGWSGMVLAEAASDARPGEGTKLELVNFEGALYVRRFCLPDSGLALVYPLATEGKFVRLARTRTRTSPAAIASPAGGR